MQACATASFAQDTRPQAPAGATPELDRVVALEAIVNGERTGAWPFVERQGALHVGADAIEQWRLRMPADIQPIRVRGAEFYPLSGFPGYSARVNYATLAVDLTFSPDAFTGTRLTLQKELQRPQPSAVLPSVFVNYDLNFQRSSVRDSGSSTDAGVLLESGVSGGWGVLTSTAAGRNLVGASQGQRRQWLRLETTYTRNFPQDNVSLRVGDSSTRAGLWGRNVYFGGVQLGTNYELTPGFVTQPQPLLTGVSSAPSTVELYVNDVLRRVSQVPAGPFVVDNSVAITGSGEARLVVRDVLGREVVIVQPFFTSVNLLAPGLSDWSAEVGAVREDLGLASNHYGQPFATGTWRRGLTRWLTVEGRAEWTRGQRTVGVGAIAATPGEFLLRGAAVRSMNDRVGDGAFWLLGLERQWTQAAVSLQWLGATRGYRELGIGDALLPLRQQIAANFNYNFGETSVGVGLARIERHGAAGVTTLGLNLGHRFAASTMLNASVSKAFGASGGTSVGVSMQFPLDQRRLATAAVSSHGGITDAYATVSQFQAEAGEPGWRVLAGRLNREAHAEAGLDYSGPRGRIYSDLSASPTRNSLRLGASGGLAVAAGRAFFTQRLDDSFAVVELKGHPGVGVGLGSNMSVTTDAAGVAFLPHLSAYQQNQVRLNAQDLPVSVELDSIERIAVPSWRSAVKVEFPVRSGRAALLAIRQENGEPVPPGAVLTVHGDPHEVYVGRRGEAFVTGLEPRSEVTVQWSGERCAFTLTLPAAQDDVLRPAPLTCRRIR